MIYPKDRTIAPQIALAGKRFDEWITINSATFQKMAVDQLQRFMAQETGFKYESLELPDCWESSFEVLSLTFEMHKSDKATNDSHFLVGFIWMIVDDQHIPELYNCYLHPSFRGEKSDHNLMFKGWKKLVERYPKFEIAMPVSGAMKAFLSKDRVDTTGVSNIDSILADNQTQ